jgi:tetratricopeptide (TPR) repeat protein
VVAAQGEVYGAAVTDSYRYWAFISYSHADARWADWLHKSLERYRIPGRLVGRETPTGTVPKKLFPVFRDRDELAGSSELGRSLQDALRQSRFQIVIASPNAARSRWVNEEIKYFKSLGRSSRVLALIVDGEPNATDKGQPALECFPDALRFQLGADGQLTNIPAEQVAADARKHADGRGNALLKLLAGILGVGFDELRQRELQARNRRLAALASVATAVAAVTLVLAVVAYNARNDALRRQQQAEDLLQFMLGDLREKLEPIGKLAILDAVGRKGMEYFATLEQRDLTDSALSSRAKALRQIGDVRLKQGDMAGASEAFGEALKLDEELARRYPDDTALLGNMAKSEYTMGEAHYMKGELDTAQRWWQRQATTVQRLLELEPDKPERAHDFANAHMNLGAIELARNNLKEAEDEFGEALARQEALVAAHPDNLAYLHTLASIRTWLLGLEQARLDWAKAIEHGQASARTRRRMVQLQPDNVPYQYNLVEANVHTLFSQGRVQPIAPDAEALREALALTERLVAVDPDNTEYARQRVVVLSYLAGAHLQLGQWRAVDKALRQELELARATYRRAPGNAVVADALVGVLAQAARVAWLQNKPAVARAHIQDARGLGLAPDQLGYSLTRSLDLGLLEWLCATSAAERTGAQAHVEKLMAQAKAAGHSIAPDMMLRYVALKGDRQEAAAWLAKLTAAERSSPYVRRLCRATGACEMPET